MKQKNYIPITLAGKKIVREELTEFRATSRDWRELIGKEPIPSHINPQIALQTQPGNSISFDLSNQVCPISTTLYFQSEIFWYAFNVCVWQEV